MMNYQETLQFLFQLQIKGMKFGLTSMAELLSLLDDPHQQLKSIHIAGTNGKGSTSAMMASILEQSGYKVGLYTSPHLIDFSERIKVNSVPISQTDVTRISRLIQDKIKGRRVEYPTFFEWTTAMALLYFAEQQVDIAVIEVGLGGRLDSTNVIVPLLSIITNIDFDHQEYLGDTLLDIGYEKAGIIKKEVPVISGILQKEIRDLVLKTADSLESRLYQFGTDFRWFPSSQVQGDLNVFNYHGINHEWLNLSIPLMGEHQKINASLALAGIEVLNSIGFQQREEGIRRGLQNVYWPGRIEIVQKNPLILLDGAHNPSGASMLAKYLYSLPTSGHKILVLGIMKDKDIRQIGEILFPWADEIILTRSSFSRAAGPEELLRKLPSALKPVHLIGSLSEVFIFLEKNAGMNDMICFTGSLYTIGEAKAILEGVPIAVPLHG